MQATSAKRVRGTRIRSQAARRAIVGSMSTSFSGRKFSPR
jgi:hypothetical protein